MTGSIRAAETVAVTIGGDEIRGLEAITVEEFCAPGIDRAEIALSVGRLRRWDTGAIDETYSPVCEIGDAVEISASGGWAWSGTVSAIREDGSGGRRRMTVSALGVAARLARDFLTQWYDDDGALIDTVPVLNEGGVGNRTDDTVDGDAYGWDPTSRTAWTAIDALNTLCQLAGLTIELPVGFDGLEEVQEWRFNGVSFFEAISTVVSRVRGYRWRLVGTQIRVYAQDGTDSMHFGAAYVSAYSYGLDASDCIASVRAVARERILICTLSIGQLSQDWTADEATAKREKGRDENPAGRRFGIAPGATVDGIPLAGCDVLSSLPATWIDDAWDTSADGEPVAFLQRSSGVWVPWAVRITPRADAPGLWIDAPGWTGDYWLAADFRVTLAVRLRDRIFEDAAGGIGEGTLVLLTGRRHVEVSDDTMVDRDEDDGSAVYANAAVIDDARPGLDADARELVESRGTARPRLTWTEEGVAARRPDPGTAIRGIRLPGDSSNTLFDQHPIIERRSVQWSSGGHVSTTWSTEAIADTDRGVTR